MAAVTGMVPPPDADADGQMRALPPGYRRIRSDPPRGPVRDFVAARGEVMNLDRFALARVPVGLTPM
ncbi:hypothetical protein [Nonomuraea salmonea]|uniref:Uncharacterized protein n=1 Tax=Nonomuraea salmonea TaxID=46181 RepID=A0ABV5NF56_9ACTN